MQGATNAPTVTAYAEVGAVSGTQNAAVNCTGTNVQAGLRITEFMASNAGVVRDPADNNADDWFDTYKPAAQAVDLAGLLRGARP